ncbi:IclR family transcriptional regulator [Actinopolymorpha alba]|uniref:IclR family transcriptional regulator n=1 Tax=Actinopolymorpha alba TaxID=533267 RepID=UPI0012F632FC|nr:IclR family transcriptional regulator [Actinopolymorpha alba]
MAEADYIVKPVYKALQVLRCLGEAGRALTLGEVCQLVGLPKSTTFKYLRTLRATGFATHDAETDTYRIGLLVWDLGQLSGDQSQLRELALPAMRTLHRAFDETVNLAVPDGRAVVYLEMIESTRALRMQARLGSRDPMYSTAVGKAMLAALPGNDWRDRLPRRLTARTPRTITSLTALRRDLTDVRQCGYALDRGENEAGVSCVAAPVLDRQGRVVAAISVAAPDTRLDDALLARMAAAVVDAASSCSSRLGHRSGPDGWHDVRPREQAGGQSRSRTTASTAASNAARVSATSRSS